MSTVPSPAAHLSYDDLRHLWGCALCADANFEELETILHVAAILQSAEPEIPYVDLTFDAWQEVGAIV